MTPSPHPRPSPSPNPNQVLEEGLPLLEELNGVPARKPTASTITLALVLTLHPQTDSQLNNLNPNPNPNPNPNQASSIVYGAAAKAGGDVRSRIEQEYRPLLKVQVAACTLS